MKTILNNIYFIGKERATGHPTTRRICEVGGTRTIGEREEGERGKKEEGEGKGRKEKGCDRSIGDDQKN